MLPLYKKVVQGCTEKDIWYLLAVFFVFLSLFPILEMFERFLRSEDSGSNHISLLVFPWVCTKGKRKGRVAPAVIFSVGTLGLIFFLPFSAGHFQWKEWNSFLRTVLLW